MTEQNLAPQPVPPRPALCLTTVDLHAPKAVRKRRPPEPHPQVHLDHIASARPYPWADELIDDLGPVVLSLITSRTEDYFDVKLIRPIVAYGYARLERTIDTDPAAWDLFLDLAQNSSASIADLEPSLALVQRSANS